MPTMILDPSRARGEVALVGDAADDNGRRKVHHSSVSSALRSHCKTRLLSIHSERGTRNAWDLEIEIVNG